MTDTLQKKPFLGIYFASCSVYSRLYPNKEKTAYVGRCPKCLTPARVKIGEKGSSQRIFKAYCR